MKAKFKKDFSYPWFWGPVVAFLIFLVAYVILGHAELWNMLAFVGVVYVLIANFYPYQLMDNNMLQGNGVIDELLIRHLEKLDKGVKVYYAWAVDGKERSRFFAVKDKDYFISTLLDINPNIKLN